MNHFYISDNRELYYIPDVPVAPLEDNKLQNYYWKIALKRAKEKGILVKNREEVEDWILICCCKPIWSSSKPRKDFALKTDVIYSLDDSYKVEIVHENVPALLNIVAALNDSTQGYLGTGFGSIQAVIKLAIVSVITVDNK